MKKNAIIFLKTLFFLGCVGGFHSCGSMLGPIDGIYGEYEVVQVVSATEEPYSVPYGSYKLHLLEKMNEYQDFSDKIQMHGKDYSVKEQNQVKNYTINHIHINRNSYNDRFFWGTRAWYPYSFYRPYYGSYYYDSYPYRWGFYSDFYDPYWHHYGTFYNPHPYYFYGGDVYVPRYQYIPQRRYSQTHGRLGDSRAYGTENQRYNNQNNSYGRTERRPNQFRSYHQDNNSNQNYRPQTSPHYQNNSSNRNTDTFRSYQNNSNSNSGNQRNYGGTTRRSY